MPEKYLHYKDIALIPRYSAVKSRSEIDTSVNFLGRSFKIPILPSNMATTIDFNLATQLSQSGYFYILHRFYPYEDIFNWIKTHQEACISISVGVKNDDVFLIDKIYGNNLRVDFITIDVAHGYCEAVKKMIQYIKDSLPNTNIIVGNVFGDLDSIKHLEEWGANAIKVGLSYGAGCTTYDKTGFASPMFTCGLKARSYTNLPLIGDGGIRSNGDIAKAIVAGYTLVMAGSMFAACNDSPAEVICGKKHYYGSASVRNKGYNKHVEGREVLLDFNGMTYIEKLEEIKQDLQSSISYAGGNKLEDLYRNGQTCLI